MLRQGQPLEAALGPATRAIERADDRALAHAIAAAVLRRLPDLDTLIDSATQQALPDDAKARMVLRIALAQSLVLDTPPHAAIATALPLVAGGPKRLVHGVFGTLMRRRESLPDPPTLLPEVAARWTAAWGAGVADAAAAMLAEAPLDLHFADDAAATGYAAAHGGRQLAAGHVRLVGRRDVTLLPGYSGGGWWVQDLAASVPASLLGPGDGRSVLDLCAAPGGKTMQLAAAGWRVTALDISARRLERLRGNLARTGLHADIIAADALAWQPGAAFDSILIDAPCTATGIFRRHPDVLHRIGERDIATLSALQARLLDRAAGWLAPGGTMIYAVCSLEPAEGEAQVAAFLARHRDWRRVAIGADELPGGVVPSPDGDFRALPGMLASEGGLDGFYAARLRLGDSAPAR